MKKFLFGCLVAISGLTTSLVSAQDFCCPTDCCENNSFKGFYVGGNLGAISHTSHHNDLDGFIVNTSGWSAIRTRFTGGLQAGYDFQCNNILVGVVGDWNWANVTKRFTRAAVATQDFDSTFKWFTTIRARAGITVCDALFYLTAGAAGAKIHNTWHDGATTLTHNNFRWGWTGGVGTEFLVGCNLSVAAELLYLQFDSNSRTFTVVEDSFRFDHSDSAWVGRVALNYRFGDLF